MVQDQYRKINCFVYKRAVLEVSLGAYGLIRFLGIFGINKVPIRICESGLYCKQIGVLFLKR